jgi:hypothetical protein
MRRSLLIASVLLMAADLPPVTLKLGPPFKVPGLPPNGTVDFQMPFLSGQDRKDLTRCYSLCHGSVVGYPNEPEHRTPDQRNPSISIAAIEMRLQ